MGAYGIDLGTSNCLVAEVVENYDGSIEIACLSDSEGYETFPSVVYFEDDERYKVGAGAVGKLVDAPESTVELVKIRLGKTKEIEVKIGDKICKKSPQEICSYMLAHLNNLYNGKIDEAILTVPAYFEQMQKDSTNEVGAVADIKINEMIEEPVAAIMYHLFIEYKKHGVNWLHKQDDKNILVFDFGGGTLDLSLIQLETDGKELKPTVLDMGGSNKLGGNTIDFVFTKYAIDYLERMNPQDKFVREVVTAYNDYYSDYITEGILKFKENVSKEVKMYISLLKQDVEQVKCSLSDMKEDIISFEGSYQSMKITREEFEERVLKHRTLNIKKEIQAVLEAICKKEKRVDEVLLVGGSSRIPKLREIIVEVFEGMGLTEEDIIVCDEYDRAVAKGAAIVAAIEKGMEIEPFYRNRCRSIVPRTIQIKTVNTQEEFIKEGTEYPLSKDYDIKVGHALSEEVNIKLLEKVKLSKTEWEEKEICKLTFFLPIYYTGDDIEVSMSIDKTGMYQIKAIHKKTREQVEYEPERLYALGEKEIIRLRKLVREKIDVSD